MGRPRKRSMRSARRSQSRGIEFFFAQFVDMYGKPSAKLIRPRYLDELVEDGAGFAGFAAGEIGQVPARPRHRGDARPRQLHPRAVAAEPRALRLRRHRRGRAVAVLPAHDPAQPARDARASSATSSSSGSSSSTSSSAATRTARSRSPTRYDTLEKPCYDMAGADAPVRLPHDRLEVLQRARLGQLRERPRGRERPVRAELRVRRRARHVRPRDLLPLHGRTRSREQHGMIATFMPKPFTHLTGNGCHFHMSLWKRRRRTSSLDEADPRGLGPLGRSPTTSSAG